MAQKPRDNEALPFLDPRILQREEAGHAGERGEQRRGPERALLRDPISRATGSIIGLQSVAHLELSIVATPLRQQAGVLLVGVASS